MRIRVRAVSLNYRNLVSAKHGGVRTERMPLNPGCVSATDLRGCAYRFGMGQLDCGTEYRDRPSTPRSVGLYASPLQYQISVAGGW